jgi:hypothetical protein
MEESDLLSVLLEEEPVEEEWNDLGAPILTLTNTGVLCDACGGVSILKWHISRSGFSFTCNKCRRKQSRKAAQTKYAKKMEKVNQIARLKSALKQARKELKAKEDYDARRQGEERNQEGAEELR